MSDRKLMYERYLSAHYASVGAADHIRQGKKDRVRQNYAPFLPADRQARILDIGPGYGELLEWLVGEAGFSAVEAVDLSPEVAQYCNRLVPGSTTLVEDTTAFLQERRATFERIFMLHVLEHIPKHETLSFLQALREALKPGGMALIEVPNVACPVVGPNVRYSDFTHEVGYTELSLHYVLTMAGFADVQVLAYKLPNNHWARPAQRALQVVLNAGVKVVYGAYGLWRPKVLSANLVAAAVR